METTILFMLLIPLGFVGTFGYGRWVHKRWDRVLAQLAQHYGWLFHASGNWFTAERLRGHLLGLTVDVAIAQTGTQKSRPITKITVDPHSDLLQGLAVKPAGMPGLFDQLFGHNDIEIGVSNFDARFDLAGIESSMVALFNDSVRSILSDPELRDVTITDGRIVCTREGYVNDHLVLVRVIDRMVQLGVAFRGPNEMPQAKLGHNVAHDASLEFRIRSLSQLMEKWPHAHHTLNVAVGCLTADQPSALQLRAAQGILGLPASATAEADPAESDAQSTALSALRSIVLDPELDEAHRGEALQVIARHTPELSALKPLLMVAPAKKEDTTLSHIIFDLAAEHQWGLPFERFDHFFNALKDTTDSLAVLNQSQRLEIQPDADASVSAARALEFVADARAVVALLKLLESRDEAVATAAASSLGRSADINAVQPLLNRLEGFLVGADLRTAVRTAVTELQSSANQLSQGGLTVVDEDRAGGLSQVDEAENTSTE